MTELLVGFHRDVISCELARQGVRSPAPHVRFVTRSVCPRSSTNNSLLQSVQFSLRDAYAMQTKLKWLVSPVVPVLISLRFYTPVY